MIAPAPSHHEPSAARPSRRKHLLVVSENGLYPQTLGGMEIRASELVTDLQDTYDVSLLTAAGVTACAADGRRLNVPGRARSRTGHDVAGLWAPTATLAEKLIRIAVARKHVRRSLSELQPDLIYFHRFVSLNPVVLYELIRSGIPIIAWFGDQHSSRLRRFAEGSWLRRVLFGIQPVHLSDPDVTLIFNCQFLRLFYAPLFEGFSNQFVVYDGVDVRRFRPASTPPDSARFVFLGRLTADKGFVDFCRAVALLPDRLVGGVEIIGDGPMLRQGLSILQASGRANLVGGVGALPFEAVPLRLQTASILVSPSRDEGMPASVLEAMACGLAVISTNVGGTPEVVRHEETGLLVSPEDLAGLASACRRVAADAQLRRRLGRNARSLVAARYDSSASFAETRRLIERAIERNTGGDRRPSARTRAHPDQRGCVRGIVPPCQRTGEEGPSPGPQTR
jgi:glycosyltransferase involved in cell wall biosynthesis